MSLTDDTNNQTIDIPLPKESHINTNYQSITASTNSEAEQQMSHPIDDGNTSTTDQQKNNINNNSSIDQTFNPSLQQSYQSYYSYYSSAYNMPQVMPQGYPYFVPVVQPLVPVIPSLQQTIQQQNQSIVNSNHSNNNNSKGDVNNDDDYGEEEEEDDEDDDPTIAKKPSTKASNVLPIHCNDKMGLNPLIYTNIQQSPYFKNNLFQLKTYHEVIDEIFYHVKHLEPWEKGSRKVYIHLLYLYF